MTILRNLALLVTGSLLLTTQPSMSEMPMPDMPPNLVVISQSKCTDDETGEKGYCVEFVAPGGDGWLVMTQNNQIVLIRHLYTDKPYEQVWTADQYGSY